MVFWKFIYFWFNIGPSYKEVYLVILFVNNETIVHKVEFSKGDERLNHTKHPFLLEC